MRTWHLKDGDPLILCLAADARDNGANYLNDQIWQIKLGSGEPAALSLETTYALRAKSMRLFPRFTKGNNSRIDPSDFAKPPIINQIFPNYLTIEYSPFNDIDVISDYWVPSSSVIVGRVKITNQSDGDQTLYIEWISQLTPTTGKPMIPVNMQAASILIGETGNIFPVIFVTGGAQHGKGSYPNLTLPIKLQPGEASEFKWTHVAESTTENSFQKARDYAKVNFEANYARLELVNSGLIEIHTGDPDWDATFTLSQIHALRLLMNAPDDKKRISYVINRLPDQGYSITGTGKEYNHLWNGQTPFDTNFIYDFLLPSEITIAKRLLENFLANQQDNGFIDWKPGLVGQQSGLMATPLLAELAWRIFEVSEDKKYLKNIFSGLYKFFKDWLSPLRDIDQDGCPEWDHPLQIGMDVHPLYSTWNENSRGINISYSESPGLCAFLYNECQIINRIARLLSYDSLIPSIEEDLEILRSNIELFWDSDNKSYMDRDRDTHKTSKSELIAKCEGSKVIPINRKFSNPVRFVIKIYSIDDKSCSPDIFLHGTSVTGKSRVEHIVAGQVKWHLGKGTTNSDQVYKSLDRIEIRNLGDQVITEIFSAGFDVEIQTSLLPLWAKGIEQKQAKYIIERSVINSNKFWRPFGIPICSNSSEGMSLFGFNPISIPWNSMIGQGLLHYGYHKEAAQLITKNMAAIIQNLKAEQSFRLYYNSETGHGSGERNALSGLAPLGLFLSTLGIKILSPQRVLISGGNPFPWPVTIKYRGLTVLKQHEHCDVIFPDGLTAHIEDPTPRYISQCMD